MRTFASSPRKVAPAATLSEAWLSVQKSRMPEAANEHSALDVDDRTGGQVPIDIPPAAEIQRSPAPVFSRVPEPENVVLLCATGPKATSYCSVPLESIVMLVDAERIARLQDSFVDVRRARVGICGREGERARSRLRHRAGSADHAAVGSQEQLA